MNSLTIYFYPQAGTFLFYEYAGMMADTCGFDLDEIILEKVKKNAEKYPVEKAYGSKEKYTKLKDI